MSGGWAEWVNHLGPYTCAWEVGRWSPRGDELSGEVDQGLGWG